MENYNELFAAFDEQGRDTDRLREENEILKAQVADLLAACEMALEWVNEFGLHGPFTFGGEAAIAETLRAAIAKAKGE